MVVWMMMKEEKGNERREGRESGMTPFVTHGPLYVMIR
jgi:hypothetical protein